MSKLTTALMMPIGSKTFRSSSVARAEAVVVVDCDKALFYVFVRNPIRTPRKINTLMADLFRPIVLASDGLVAEVALPCRSSTLAAYSLASGPIPLQPALLRLTASVGEGPERL